MKGKNPIGMLLLLTAILAVAALLSLSVGAVSIPAERVVRILGSTPAREPPATDVTIVWDLRLPRILLAGLIGGGAGCRWSRLSGSVSQSAGRSFHHRRLQWSSPGGDAGDRCRAA